MRIEVNSLKQTKKLGLVFAKYLMAGMCILLEGDLGAGKTTFTKAIAKGLKISDNVNSPTFTILKIYEGDIPLYHIDAYRLEGINQDLGFEEYFEGDGVCIIEWASFIAEQLPLEYLKIKISNGEDENRVFEFEGMGNRYLEIIERLKNEDTCNGYII